MKRDQKTFAALLALSMLLVARARRSPQPSPLPHRRRGGARPGPFGEVYKGAMFWDTELYMLPMFSTTLPEAARNLVAYRATGDHSLLLEGGAEVAFECARFLYLYSYYKNDIAWNAVLRL